jgi:hypothetical protein
MKAPSTRDFFDSIDRERTQIISLPWTWPDWTKGQYRPDELCDYYRSVISAALRRRAEW